MFFYFYQNNSGGRIMRNSNVSRLVIIEAKNYSKANQKAEELGIYFDGVRKGYDC